MSHRVIVLWSVPRSVSTSFERMMSARGDHIVFDEPFSRSYYFGPDRRSSRYSETLPDSSAEDVLETIEKAALERPSSSRTWPTRRRSCSVPTCWGASRTVSSSVTRQRRCAPWPTLARLHRRRGRLATPRRGGARHRLAGTAEGGPGRKPALSQPRRVVEAWCERMGLPYDPEALTWEPGMRPEWDLWGDWHASTARSTGFSELRDPPPPPTPDEPRLHEAYQEALPVYRRLAADAIGADHPAGSTEK